jgi:hypothetical protein
MYYFIYYNLLFIGFAVITQDVAEHFEGIVCWLCSHQLLVVYGRAL